MIGATFRYYTELGTIREHFSCSERYNLVHDSDSPESAQQEIRMLFKPNELIDYTLNDIYRCYGKTISPKK
jgi:nucleoside-diphosphate kinase